ncbi:MliC family protein [Sphingomonas sp. IC-56]|uniref:MliC family protein n=1 Tax=Sphingomonas sp. IC-56 TaxID=2898529 RepID=UPI001E478361|nr:MliC family protein [Sphingomonas sp. IC-56]MCD2323191.1 MliC family protein [Sphingomonas sp. IC-56]
MRLFLPLAACTLAACSNQPADNGSANVEVAAADATVNSAGEGRSLEAADRGTPAAPADTATPISQTVTPPAPGEPGGLPDDRTPVSEAPFTEDSAQGAANVVQTYYALLEAGKYREAWALWRNRGQASGMSAQAFAASFARYSEYHANVGAPGRIDAGAGQRYVTVPVQVYGRLKQGNRPFNLLGSATLRRAGDVDGATAEQRRWRIESIEVKPRGEAKPAPSDPGAKPASPAEEIADNRSTARYRCMDGSRLVGAFDLDHDRVTVSRGGKVLATLRRQRVASGVGYAAKGYELRAKGSDMTFTAPGQPPIACRVID